MTDASLFSQRQPVSITTTSFLSMTPDSIVIVATIGIVAVYTVQRRVKLENRTQHTKDITNDGHVANRALAVLLEMAMLLAVFNNFASSALEVVMLLCRSHTPWGRPV